MFYKDQIKKENGQNIHTVIEENTVAKKGPWTLKKSMLFLCLAVIFALCVSHLVALHQMQKQVAEKVIRFHVLANSDSSSDQELKLQVRDRVGTYVGAWLETVDSQEEGRQVIQSHLADIEDLARTVIQEQGYDYTVSASLENCYFPIKAYGKAIFPPGEYQALRIVIGQGEGKNWWCVLYPNLCFSGSLYQIDETASTEELQKVLTPEEYKMIMENKEYEISFRLYEVFSLLKNDDGLKKN